MMLIFTEAFDFTVFAALWVDIPTMVTVPDDFWRRNLFELTWFSCEADVQNLFLYNSKRTGTPYCKHQKFSFSC